MSNFAKSLLGQKFGRLTVIRRTDNYHGQACWVCQCECGGTKDVRAYALRHGEVKSCGCLITETHTKHGHCNRGKVSPEYRTWQGMHRRVADTAPEEDRRIYFSRGIKVCKRWGNFENFLADMGLRPSSNHSIDRIDGSKGYYPENCRWATVTEQARNRRNSINVTLDGVTKCLMDWSTHLGVGYRNLYYRYKQGCSPEEILSVTNRLTGKRKNLI